MVSGEEGGGEKIKMKGGIDGCPEARGHLLVESLHTLRSRAVVA